MGKTTHAEHHPRDNEHEHALRVLAIALAASTAREARDEMTSVIASSTAREARDEMTSVIRNTSECLTNSPHEYIRTSNTNTSAHLGT